eukprot:GHVS01024139.1.p2 GENE.GHVS01024139.1~~GHVS01024139.1.p2  ORF type:complete len:102 (-),score=11.79 GHVS01024139.1:209-514(-)
MSYRASRFQGAKPTAEQRRHKQPLDSTTMEEAERFWLDKLRSVRLHPAYVDTGAGHKTSSKGYRMHHQTGGRAYQDKNAYVSVSAPLVSCSFDQRYVWQPG